VSVDWIQWYLGIFEEGFVLTFFSMAAIQAFFALGTFVGPVFGGIIVTVSFLSLVGSFSCIYYIVILTNLSLEALLLEMGILH
jgi:hypothetical protein